MIQFTPPGSGCSVIFGKNVTAAAPGSAQGLYLIVSDIEAARDELLGRGVKISEVFHDAGGVYAGTDEPYCLGGSGSAVRIPSIAATARSPRSVIRTATAGCSRRSRRGCPVASTPRRRPSRRRTIWRARFGVRRLPTASTRSAPGAARRELARLVRRVHGGGAGRDGAADISDYEVIVIGDAPGERLHRCPGQREAVYRRFDAIVIGTGQAGPSVASRLAAAGMKVAIIERNKFGGTCVNTGCIPTKTIVASAYATHVARRGAEYGVDVTASECRHETREGP